MAAGTASLCCCLLLVAFVSAEEKTITADPGQDVTLTCGAPNSNITAVQWSRADLEDKYVLLYSDGWFDPDYQHPSFRNRVDLQDRRMKDGDVSLILKDVTAADEGTYECRFFVEETSSWNLLSIIYLRVDPGQPGGLREEGGKKEGSAGLTVPALLLFVGAFVVGFIFGFFDLESAENRNRLQVDKKTPADRWINQPPQQD